MVYFAFQLDNGDFPQLDQTGDTEYCFLSEFTGEEIPPREWKPVTLCIAAACQYRNQPRVITCTDWKVSTSYGSAENSDKMRWVKKPNWIALTAGRKPSSNALVKAYRRAIADEELTEENALDKFTVVAQDHLTKLKEAYVLRNLGVTYEHLRLHWRRQFPERIVLETLQGLQSVDMGASLIIAGFVSLRQAIKPLICQVDKSGAVSIPDHFACIGEGAIVANPTLLRRSYSSETSLMDAIYRLYEAKVLAEVFDSVGDSTSIDVLYLTCPRKTQPMQTGVLS